jgi:hypothetical protein
MAGERSAEPPLPLELLATANLALGNGLQLERLTRPDEIDTEAIQQAMWLLARTVAPLEEGAEDEPLEPDGRAGARAARDQGGARA